MPFMVLLVGLLVAGDSLGLLTRRVGRRPPTHSTAPGTNRSPATEAQVVDEIKRQVSELRGLPWKESLNVAVVSKDELARRVRQADERDTHPDRLAGDEATLKVLHLIPENLDYVQAVRDLLAEQVVGMYDPDTKQLSVADAGRAEMDGRTKMIVAHELDHALTDQHFGYGPKVKALDDADRQEEAFGFTSLLEGDAVLLQDQWADRNLNDAEQVDRYFGGRATPVFDRAPQYLRESLLFPYDKGREFVKSQYDRGGYAAVDEVYRRPPVSTEQILHPDLYQLDQRWVAPSLPDVAGRAACQQVRTGTLGEFDTGEVLRESLVSGDSDRAAAGWNGDALVTMRCGSSLAIADRWQGDTERDAVELADALIRWAATWSGSGQRPGADGRFSGGAGAGRVVRSGSRVDLVLADDAATAQRVAAAMR